MVKFNRIKISTDATQKLRTLKGRTGLAPNILCRIALCYSLERDMSRNAFPTNEEGMEFNRYTLTGEYDSMFVSLIKQRCIEDGLDPKAEFMDQFKLHLNNGIHSIYGKIKDISDLSNLVGDRK